MNHIISSFCNPENEKTSDLCNIFSKNSHICNEGVLKKGENEKQTRKMISQLKVKKSIRRYNRLDRLMPGAVFYYQGVRYVMRGQHCEGTYLQTVGMGSKDFPAKKCKIVANNEGLVFVS